MNENTTQRLPQNIARIIKKIEKIKKLKKLKINDPPRSSWPDGWLGGRLPGWLSVSKGILKESYTNPFKVQPASQPASQPAGQPTKRSPARRICGGR